MLRLQTPLPEEYTAAPPTSSRRDRRGQGRPRRPRLHPRPPLPARRGHALGRRPGRLVPAVGARPGAPRGRLHRLLRRPLHGRVGRRAHRPPPAGGAARPQRRLLDGRHGRHRQRRGGLGGPRTASSTSTRVVPDHLHELVGGAEGVRRPPRRRGVHVDRTPGPCSSGRSGPGPRAAPAATKVLFFPDQHLGRNTGLAMGYSLDDMRVWDPRRDQGGLDEADLKDATFLLWKGHCSVHQRFRPEHVAAFRARASRRHRRRAPGVQPRRVRAGRPGRLDRLHHPGRRGRPGRRRDRRRHRDPPRATG